MTDISLVGRVADPGEPVFVIAEAGVNHDGDPERALELVDAAARSGADAVKFQTFVAERVAGPAAPKAGYQIETTGEAESQLEMLRQLELDGEALRALARRCDERGVLFLSSVFDEESVALLEELDVAAIKVGSGELTNLPLLERIAAAGRPVILSTGMGDLDEVRAALAVLGDCAVVLLHCTSSYPADPAEANLRAIETLRDTFDLPVGYSDHTTGPESALAAVALGARVVEKHFTLDRTLPGPDHRASIEPAAFAELVAGIRIVSSALGDGRKQPAPSELGTRDLVRRSLVAARDLAAGTTVAAEMLVALRPGTGISPARRDEIVGRRLRRELAANEPIEWSDLE